MPIETFNDETFVAFIDISGFKSMMKDKNRAIQALDHFYKSGYFSLSNHRDINGIFVSDCGILFARNRNNNEALQSLLQVIKEINSKLIEHKIMLTNSIAWGHFMYNQRIEFMGIEKNLIIGNGYLSAFFDNELGKPKIQPGECRIIKQGLAELPVIEQHNFIESTTLYYKYYWNIESPEDIPKFKRAYQDSYNLKYSGMLSALRGDWA